MYIWKSQAGITKKYGSPPLCSLLPIRAKTHLFKIKLVVAGGGFLFYCTTQYIKLDMESNFVQI